jgi:hypothetical protein
MATTAAPNHTPVAGGQQGQLVDATAPTDPPNLTQPLINEPAQGNPPASITVTGPLQYLIGTWTNQNIGQSLAGGPENPYSYNLMILPQVDPESPYGYILKSMPYYEEITFTAVHGSAANRGGLGTQVSYAILYEQRVYIAAGPAKDMLVHFENGIWGYLDDQQQILGPYGNGNDPGLGTQIVPNSVPPTQEFKLFKQISVPHGNSVLAGGNFTNNSGVPTIGPPPQVLPSGINTDAYDTASVGNLNPDRALNPNLPLSQALAATNPQPTSFIQLDVDSQNGGGAVTNIGFEQQHCDVMRYYATYWLEAFGGSESYTQLQYSQTIMMSIPLADGDVLFPHITTNTLTKVPGSGPAG